MQNQENKKVIEPAFNKIQKGNNQHPVIGVNFDNMISDIGRDVYGQPLSPTSILTNTKSMQKKDFNNNKNT